MPMYNLWDILIKPALDCIELKHLVEIGADAGENTKNILNYCRQRGARLTTIDTVPSREVLALLDDFSDMFTVSSKTSLEVLPELSSYDAILIDGDHNWYTVYHELKTVEKSFAGSDRWPLVFFHDIAWPYGRRDMYYSPEMIPNGFRHNYSVKGMLPGQSDLAEEFGLNVGLCNALHEGGSRNGVLTAIEDFIKEFDGKLHFAIFNGYHGLGMLTSKKNIENFPKLTGVFDRIEWIAPIGDAMQNTVFEAVRLSSESETKSRLLHELNQQLNESSAH